MIEAPKDKINDINQLEMAKKIIFAQPIELGADILEIGLDRLLEEGVIKDIPVFGSVIKIGRTIKTAHDAIFAKKVLVFAQSIHNGDGDEEKWKRHREKLENDPKRLIKEIEVLLIYIDRYTKYVKNKILANFYVLYYMEEIDWNDFEEFAEILDTVSIFDLRTLKEIYEKKYYNKDEKYNSLALKRLNNNGLVDFYNGMLVTNSNKINFTNYIAKITPLGEYFWEFGLKGINIENIV